MLAASCGLSACGSHGGAHSADALEPDAPLADASGDAAMYPANAPPTGDCSDGWCWVYPLPQGWSIEGVWGTSASDVWAFTSNTDTGVRGGTRESILHFDGTSWTTYAMPAGCGVAWYAWGTSANDVWVTGTCTMHWDGTAWSATVNDDWSTAIGGLGPSDLWRNGQHNYHWDGTQWEVHDGGGAAMAFGGSGTTTIMVTSWGGISQWTGSAWGIIDGGSHYDTKAAVVIDATHVVLAEKAGVISLWNNGTWTSQTAPVTVDWTVVSAMSLSDVWVAGYSGSAQVIYHWNGSTWSPAGASTDSGAPRGLWVDPNGSVWVGSSSSVVSVWSGSDWTTKTVGDNRAQAVWGTDWDNVWTLGSANTVMHWNGSMWADTMFPYLTSASYLAGVGWASGPDDVWIAGGQRNGGSIDRMMFHWNGSVWSTSGVLGTEPPGSPYATGFNSIWGASATDVYALAPSALYHYDGNAWTPVSAVPGGMYVFGSGANAVYVTGYEFWHWDGSNWTMKIAPRNGCNGWANSPTDVWLCGYHYDGSLFIQDMGGDMPIGTSTDVFTFYSNEPDAVPTATEWVGGYGGTSKSAGTPLVSPFSRWRTPDGHLFVAGDGLIVH